MQPLTLDFGKFNGVSLEQLALGYGMEQKGTAGYDYFYLLGLGDPKYFGRFQRSLFCKNRWNEIRNKLNNFVCVKECSICKTSPATTLSIAGSGEYGYSYKGFICCNNTECRDKLTAYVNHTRLENIGFDIVRTLERKSDSREMQVYLRRLAGFHRGLTDPYVCADFISQLMLRP